MSDWKEDANYRRDVRHGLLNIQDEQPRFPRARRHVNKPVEVHHTISFLFGNSKAFTIKKRFPTMAKAQAYADRMNQLDANQQVLRGTHPDDVRKTYVIASNQDQVQDAA